MHPPAASVRSRIAVAPRGMVEPFGAGESGHRPSPPGRAGPRWVVRSRLACQVIDQPHRLQYWSVSAPSRGCGGGQAGAAQRARVIGAPGHGGGHAAASVPMASSSARGAGAA